MTNLNLWVWCVAVLTCALSSACDGDNAGDDDGAASTSAGDGQGDAPGDAPGDDGPDDDAADDGVDDAPDDGPGDAPDDGADDAPDDGPGDAPDDGSDETPVDDGVDDGVGGVSFSDLFMPIFVEKGCTAGYCHGGGAGGLVMTDEATSYAAIVDSLASLPNCDLDTVVVAGDADASILWARIAPGELDPTNGCFTKMPKEQPELTAEEAALVRDWIEAGAQP